ncbi:ABC transporter permease [Algoriphagus sp.]|uniref:ABC transporter permease n=1 Tax=Algoriphagus sp. TaxID=1872435 RepID=UPI0027233309|nr:ABC transporter permease [Algoriphagus sp.]MDO8967744.1 ABC transporter permease [Algoriphagus sp.]MDP3200028.1 ABC transporter permease [Algoriphagus sp.]
MLKSYFLIGIRNLIREKWFSLIKILGLALGLAATFILGLYIQEDLSFDRFHQDSSQIYRVLTLDMAEGVSSKLVGVTPVALGPAMVEELPEVTNAVRIRPLGRLNISYEDKLLRCEGCFRTESSFFEIFNFPVLDGKKEGVLDEPNTIAITETLSKRIFGEESPIGKTIKVNQTLELYIVALLADPPANSHIQFDLLRSIVPGQDEENYRQSLLQWGGLNTYTYLKFDREINKDEVDAKIQAIARKNEAVEVFVPTLQAMNDVHLGSKEILFESNFNKSDMQNVVTLSIVAVLILFLAIINFANLVTAKSTSRAKEVGVRKVIGAYRSQLIGQHLSESILVVLLSAIIAYILVLGLLPVFNDLYQRGAETQAMFDYQNLLIIGGMVIAVGLISGLYPAFVLSAFNPLSVMKGAFKNTESGKSLRKSLVVFQFTISIGLIVGTVIVYQQMDFIFNTDLGYDRDQIITISQNTSNSEFLKNELTQNPNIHAIGTSSAQIGQQLPRGGVTPQGASEESTYIVSEMNIDEAFIPTMGMSIREGRNFSLETSDSLSIIINEEMAKLFEWEEPIGMKVDLGNVTVEVIGVVKDFHFATIRHKVEPLMMFFNAQNSQMALKVDAHNLNQTLADIEATWKSVNPETPFEYNFLDAEFANLYRNDQAFSSMFLHFAILAILIACLGLFGLSAYTAEQRQKEISIRKVFGASPGNIMVKLSLEFIGLVSIAIVLATILSYFAMSQWLQDFQYRIQIQPLVFLVAGLMAILITLLTISFQTVKATFSNPIKSLKSE